MPDANIFRNGNYLNFIYIQIPQYRNNILSNGITAAYQRCTPSLRGSFDQNLFLTFASNGVGNSKLHLHGFSQRFNLMLIQTQSRVPPSCCTTPEEEITTQPSASVNIFPLKYNFRSFIFEFLEEFQHN